MDIVLFGIQGSGKGTQAKFIAERYNMVIFEAGAELRKASKEDTVIGRKIKERIDNGNLVEPELIVGMAEQFVQKIPSDQFIIFDGIPRSLVQKDLFDQMLINNQRQTLYLHILVPVEKTLERLYKRALIEKRLDDTPEKIHHRQQIFHQETEPVIEGYRQDNKILTINGDQAVTEVTKEINATLDPYFKKIPSKSGEKVAT